MSKMASVSGSHLAFFSPTGQKVNLILSDGKTTTGTTDKGSYNIEIFTAGSGTPLPGVAATATIGGAVKISANEVQAGTLTSTEQLGAGAFKVVDETGHEGIKLGTGAQTVAGSAGDTITGGNVAGVKQVIDLTGTDKQTTGGAMTALGGAGSLLVEAGSKDSIVGGAGPITVSGGTTPPHGKHNMGDNGDDGRGRGDHDHDDDKSHGHGHHTVGGTMASGDTIVGGSGPMTVSGGTGDSITGGTGSLFVTSVTNSTISAGAGGTTVDGGSKDVIHSSVGGALLVDIASQSHGKGPSPSPAGSGAETVDLGAKHGATTLRDISVKGGQGPSATTSVTGFSTTMDFIASQTSVSQAGQFLGTSSVSAGNTTLTFLDGSKMTLVGITDPSKITFSK